MTRRGLALAGSAELLIESLALHRADEPAEVEALIAEHLAGLAELVGDRHPVLAAALRVQP